MPLNPLASALISNLGLTAGNQSDTLAVINASPQLTQQLNDYANRGGTLAASSSIPDAGNYLARSGDNSTGGTMLINTNSANDPNTGFSVGYSIAETISHELGHAFDPTLGTTNLASFSGDPLGLALVQTRSEAVAEVNSYTSMSQARTELITSGTNTSSTGAPLIDPSTLRITAFPGAEAAIVQCLSQAGSSTNSAVSSISVPAQCVDTAEAALAKDPGIAYLQTYYNRNGGAGTVPNREVQIDQNGSTSVTMSTADPSVLTFAGASNGITSTETITNNSDGSYHFTDTDVLNGSQIGKSIYDSSTAGGVNILLAGTGYNIKDANANVTLTASSSATINGNSNQIQLSGDNSSLIDNGNSDQVTVSGNNSTASSTGINDLIRLYGTADTSTVSGNTSWTDSFGTNDLVKLDGQNDASTIWGNNSWSDSYNSNNVIVQQGSNDASTVFQGTGNTLTSFGSSDGIWLRDNANTAIVNGNGSWADSFATNDLVKLMGQNDDSTISGNNSWSDSYGYANKVWEDGNNDASTAFQGATSNIINSNGANDGIWLRDINNIGLAHGDSDFSYSYAQDDTIVNKGNNDTGISYGDNDVIFDDNPSDTGIGYGNGDTFGGDYPGGGDGGYYGFYGFAGPEKTISAAIGSNIGYVAERDLKLGLTSQAAEAETAQLQARQALAAQVTGTGGGGAVLASAKWDLPVITWGIENTDQLDSSSMNQLDQSAEQALSAWAKATGLKFKEALPGTDPNINISTSDFDTSESGVVGYTSFKASSGSISQAAVQIENLADLQGSGGDNDSRTYAGTQATLVQTLTHEIGHALGLADDADPTSIMFYELNKNNQMLDQTDLAGIQSLYGPSNTGAVPSAVTDVAHLTQNLATFGASAATRPPVAWAGNEALGRAGAMAAVMLA